MEESKKWYTSKTIWLNILTVVGVIIATITGVALDNVTMDVIATAIIAVVNVVLRFKTNTPVTR